MTENEAIERLKYFTELWEDDNKVNDSMVVEVGKEFMDCIHGCIKALEEIKQYHSIGTIEEINRMRKYFALAKKHDTIGKVIKSCAEYEEIGTVEECREAVEKQKSLKPQEILLHTGGKGFECRNCGNELSTNFFESFYCHWCGQRLEGGDE